MANLTESESRNLPNPNCCCAAPFCFQERTGGPDKAAEAVKRAEAVDKPRDGGGGGSGGGEGGGGAAEKGKGSAGGPRGYGAVFSVARILLVRAAPPTPLRLATGWQPAGNRLATGW